MSPQQSATLDAVRECLSLNYQPTYRELGRRLGLARNTVFKHVEALIAQGKLVRTSAKIRNLALPDAIDLRGVPTDTVLAELARRGITFGALDSGTSKAYSRASVSCAADCCSNEVKPGQLMCLTHWRAIPYVLQQKILGAHRARDIATYQQAVSDARDGLSGGRWRV